MRILIVDDEPQITRVLRTSLQSNGHEVTVAQNGAEALAQFMKAQPELVITDLAMPGMDGIELTREIRARSQVPIIVLSVRSQDAAKVSALDEGADDYITKPFAIRELIARVKAVLRRFERPETPGAASVLNIETLEIDGNSMQLRVNGELVTTTATEFRLLDYLARHPGRVFSRDHLLDAVWGDARFVTPRSVDVYVRRIREKIEADPETPRYLKTMRGAGYRFDLPKSREAGAALQAIGDVE